MLPAHRPHPSAATPHELLLGALRAAFGDEHTGPVLLQGALRAARRSALPTEASQLLDFVRAYLMGPLTEELGPRLVSALIEDLTEDIRLLSTPASETRTVHDVTSSDAPKSSGIRARPSLLLVDADRFARASLARTLMSAWSCEITVADGPLDVRSVDGRIDVALVNMATPDVAAIVGALIARNPDVRVIGLADDLVSAESLLRAASVRSSRVVPRSIRPSELSELARRMMLTAR